VTQLRQRMLEELQGRKSLYGCLGLFIKWWFDLVSKVSKFADHLPSAQLLRSFAEP
jgi:hypothetical protein